MSFGDTLDRLAQEGSVAWGLLAAAVLVMLLTPLVTRLAFRTGAVDVPDRDRPRIHTRPIPRIGGLAIVVGILVPALLFVDVKGPIDGIIIAHPDRGGDRPRTTTCKGLNPWAKLLLVMAAALIPVVGYDMYVERFGLPFVAFDVGPEVSIPLTLLWITLVANLVNLIDGMDALAAGIVAVSAAALAILAMSFGRVNASILAAIVCGATLGFLWHNYHPAKIFMGDSGALTLGFVLGSLAVEGVLKTPATIALLAPLLIMAVPIVDTSFVVAKRLKYRRKPWDARPEPPPLPVPAHRLLPAQDRRLPAPVGARPRRLRDARALRAAAPGRRAGHLARGHRRRRRRRSCWSARCGWSTSSRSSRRATSRRSASSARRRRSRSPSAPWRRSSTRARD